MAYRNVVEKSVVALIRGDDVLAFRHPLAGVQLPKGTSEPGETPDATERREFFEEVGVSLTQPMTSLGTWTCPEPASLWHIFVADAPLGLPHGWRHAPTGGGDESRLIFEVMWVPMRDPTDTFHPLFHPVLDRVRHHLDQPANARANQS